MTPPIEILVHVSGPSGGADDARYRREALAFLHFDIANTHTLLRQRSRAPNLVEQTRSHAGTSDADKGQSQGVPVVQEARTSSRTEKAVHKSRAPDWPDRLPSWRPPRYPRPTASTLPWTTTKQTPHLLIERTPALPRPRTAPTPSTSSQAPRLRRSQSDSWHTPPSVIPDSQPTPPSLGPPEISSSPYLKRPFASSSPSPTRRASPPTAKRPRLQVPSSPPSEDPPVEARPPATAPFSSPPSTKRPRLEVPSSPPPENPAVAARSPAFAPSSSSPSADDPPGSPPPPHDTPRTLEIHPPRPKPSNSAFETHLTYSLTNIATRLPLADFFQPVKSTRTPRVLERGHWLVPINRWDEKLKRDFWDYLTTFVGRGQAGWGTWCVWETQEPIRAKDGDKENQTPQRREVVKVYCWGEVVGEIWLLLFIASTRNVKRIGAQWVDAGGVAVVFMKDDEGGGIVTKL
ncbi:hypothetical protein HO173_005406 [Letharia columbiana]|uniref:Uncharacterized protein n=1 Tax=Letharia columbiana TaxID=112416 RepID=A0A8H6FXL6_9LECA|nr:uncharacterized protein HO173_005406 [Letharia columbiana]KAF6236625.1 hypothetical protein HO173_005406 [Letharia columbiana]